MRVDQRTPCDSHTERCLARASAGSFAEGHAAQILHVGPYAAEAHTIEQLHAFSPPTAWSGEPGTTRTTGRPSTRPREHLKTIIRQPAKGPKCGFAARESVGGLMRQADEREMLIVSS